MIKNIYNKYQEIIKYLIFGFLTTVVSLATYYILVFTILNPNKPFELQLANIISWLTCTTFAYITNRKYVFNSQEKNITKELIRFYSSRIGTLLVDMTIMFIFVTTMHLNDKIIKIIVQIIIITLNYLLSKILVFKKENNQ